MLLRSFLIRYANHFIFSIDMPYKCIFQLVKRPENPHKNSLQDNSSIATLKKYFGSQGEMDLLIKTSLIDRKTAKKIIKNFNRKARSKASNRLNRFLKFHNDH